MIKLIQSSNQSKTNLGSGKCEVDASLLSTTVTFGVFLLK
jgi:hypothetical protein